MEKWLVNVTSSMVIVVTRQISSNFGTVFVGCILYADDIVLLSGNCYGLQQELS